MKLELLQELPECIFTELLWDCELEGDESSKAEIIHDFSNGYVSDRNQSIINDHWKKMSEESFLVIVDHVRQKLRYEMTALDRLMTKIK